MYNYNNSAVVVFWSCVSQMSNFIQMPVLPFPALADKRKGKDELNLAEFPLGILSDKEDPNRHTVTFEDVITDRRFPNEPIVRKVTVTSSPGYGGLPTAYDQDILLGLANLTKANNNFSEPRVYFTRHQLIELLGLPDSGQSYHRIARSIEKWSCVRVFYDQSWWKNGETEWAKEGFAFIDNFRLYDLAALRRRAKIPSTQYEFPFSYFKWNEVVLESFQKEYIRTLDLEFYLSLTLPTAKRIYRFLGKRFYKSRRLTFDLKTFAFHKIGITRAYESDASKIKNALRPALKELERRGFIRAVSDAERFIRVRQGVWKIAVEAKGVDGNKKKDQATAETEAVRQKLLSRGIHESVADELTSQFPAGKISEHIEHFDWLQRDGKRPSSPRGFLVDSIRKKYLAPDRFPPCKKRPVQRKTARKLSTSPDESDKHARREEEVQRAKAFWDAKSLVEREEHHAAALADARRFLGKEPAGKIREELFTAYALKHLSENDN